MTPAMEQTAFTWPPPKEKADPERAALQGKSERSNHTTTKPDRKWRRVLAALLTGNSYNRFGAARELRDWCLHTTVANLEMKGLRIDRVDEVVPGEFGAVHCKRYRLATESYQHARQLLGITHAP